MPNCLRWTAKIAAHMAIERGSQPLAGWIFGEARETPRAWPGIMNAMHGRALGAIERDAFFKICWKCSCRRSLAGVHIGRSETVDPSGQSRAVMARRVSSSTPGFGTICRQIFPAIVRRSEEHTSEL